MNKFVNCCHGDCDEHISLLMMSHRTAIYDTTRCIPAEMIFGNDLRLPVFLLIGQPEVD